MQAPLKPGLKFVFFDWDGVIVDRRLSTEVSKLYTTYAIAARDAPNNSDAQRLKEHLQTKFADPELSFEWMGGRQRVVLLRQMLQAIKENGGTSFIVSLNNPDLIKNTLIMTDLLPFFVSDSNLSTIFGSNHFNDEAGKDKQLFIDTLLTSDDTPFKVFDSQKLLDLNAVTAALIDDSPGNLRSTPDDSRIQKYLVQSNELGDGLSVEEMRMIVNAVDNSHVMVGVSGTMPAQESAQEPEATEWEPAPLEGGVEVVCFEMENVLFNVKNFNEVVREVDNVGNPEWWHGLPTSGWQWLFGSMERIQYLNAMLAGIKERGGQSMIVSTLPSHMCTLALEQAGILTYFNDENGANLIFGEADLEPYEGDKQRFIDEEIRAKMYDPDENGEYMIPEDDTGYLVLLVDYDVRQLGAVPWSDDSDWQASAIQKYFVAFGGIEGSEDEEVWGGLYSEDMGRIVNAVGGDDA